MRTPLVILILGLVLFTGCTEDFASFHEPSSGSAFREGSQDKFRHAGLMDRAVKGHGKNGLAIGLIFKLDKQSILERYGTLDRYAVLERYATLERYNVLERYEYQHVFDGFAIWASADSVNGLIDEMVADPDIEWVEPDIEVALGPASVTPPTVETGQIVPWGVTRIGAYDYEVDHLSDVSVFVMDTGVHHDDLELEDTFDFTTGLESSSTRTGTARTSPGSSGPGTMPTAWWAWRRAFPCTACGCSRAMRFRMTARSTSRRPSQPWSA